MSERLVLFSQPSPAVFEKLKTALFPEYLKERVFAYMPADGANVEANPKFTPIWQQFAKSNSAQFLFIDNSKRGEEVVKERAKILSSNILIITGGNTFKLSNHLRQSGLGETIKEFWQKSEVVLAGFSAGAIVLTPTIGVANYSDPNEVGLSDLTGLNILNFEVWPHYDSSQDQSILDYQSKKQVELKTIGNEEIIVINK